MSYRPLGFEYQPDYEGSCGAYALGHALNLVGRSGEIDNFKNTSNYVSWFRSTKKNFSLSSLLDPINTFLKISSDVGTVEKGILSGIKKNACIPIKIDNYSRPSSRKILDSNLSKGYPVILFVNYSQEVADSGHWFVCAGKSEGKYIIIDSLPYEDDDIISFYTWGELAERCINYETEETYFQLYGFAVQSPNDISAVKKFHKYINKIFKDESLQEWWGYYVADLVEILESSSSAQNKITSENFFEKYSSSFIKNIKYWNDDIEVSRIKQELLNYQIIADTYDLSISKSKIEDALVSFTAALTTASSF